MTLVTAVKNLRECATCGQVGREGVEVRTNLYYLGGVGHVLRTYCCDAITCFARRECQEVRAGK